MYNALVGALQSADVMNGFATKLDNDFLWIKAALGVEPFSFPSCETKTPAIRTQLGGLDDLVQPVHDYPISN